MFRRLALIFSVVAMGMRSMAAPNAVRSGTIGCSRRNPASRTIFSLQGDAPGVTDSLGGAASAMIYCRKCREHPMRVFRIAAVIALLASPAYAQNAQLQFAAGQALQDAGRTGAEAARERPTRNCCRKYRTPRLLPIPGAMCVAGYAQGPASGGKAENKNRQHRQLEAGTTADRRCAIRPAWPIDPAAFRSTRRTSASARADPGS